MKPDANHSRTYGFICLLCLVFWLLAGCTDSFQAYPVSPAPDNEQPVASAPLPEASPATPEGGHVLAPAGPLAPGSEPELEAPVSLAYSPDESLLMASSSGLARWQAGAWKKVELPEATTAGAVVVIPTQPPTLYVGGPGFGVLRSENGGKDWQAANTGLPNLNVTVLARHSSRPETLYAWIKGEGIYMTEDSGVTWRRAPDPGLPDPRLRGLTHAVLPDGEKTGFYAATPSGAYWSLDCF